MDSTDVGSIEMKSEDEVVVGEKRSSDDGAKEDLESVIKTKKMRNGGFKSDKEMRRIAEMVLVLSAMGNMRGGKEPTAAEMALMSEARKKMVAICEELAPKDILPKEACGSVIQDLGLQRFKENRLTMGPPKCSIVQRMEIAQQKIAEAKAFSASQQSTLPPQKVKTGSATSGESRGQLANARAFLNDQSSHVPVSAGSFQFSAPKTPAAVTAPFSSQPSTQVQAAATSMGPPGNLVTMTPRIIHFRADGRPSGPSYVSAGPGFTAVDQHATRSAAAYQEVRPTIANAGTNNKVPDHAMAKADCTSNLTSPQPTAQITRLQPAKAVFTTSTPATVQSGTHSIPGMHFVHPAPGFHPHHLEVSKVVQKLLLSKPSERPTLSAPSRDYMSKTLICQTCKLTMNEIDSLLVCDACEKGTHLRCLGLNIQKAFPRGEWHCPRCLSASNGKPFPPKYGRVTRNVNTPKGPSTMGGVHPSFEKKLGTSPEKMNLAKLAATRSSHGKPTLQPSAVAKSSSESGMAHRSGVHDSNSAERKDVGTKPESCVKTERGAPGADRATAQAPASESLPSVDRQVEHPLTDSTAKPLSVMDAADDLNGLRTQNENGQAGISDSHEGPSEQDKNNGKPKHLCASDIKLCGECNSSIDLKQHNQDSTREKSLHTGKADSEHVLDVVSDNGLRHVDWKGTIDNVVDEKQYYRSCTIDGIEYSVLDYVLCRPSGGKLIPSKLQAMWEDKQTGQKWAIVNLCYFPGDLPDGVGHPCAPDNNEVYESNRECTLRAGSIEGPCEVRPPKKYGEQNTTADEGTGPNDRERPIFECKWFYDEIRRVFRPIPG